MGSTVQIGWIEDNEKYAALGLDVKVDDDIMQAYLGATLNLVGQGAIPLSARWREWLGSIQVEEIDNCGLFVVSKLSSQQPGVIDAESQMLRKRVWDFYVGLLLSSTFAPSQTPFILSGSKREDVIDVREKHNLETPVPGLATPYPSVSKRDFESAALLASQLGRIAVATIKGGTWRLNRVLKLYVDTRSLPDILERIHQYARCIDGMLLLRAGEGKGQFRSKSELFIGPRHHALMGEIYDVRSAVEHLHENRYLEVFDRAQRLELAKKELIVEYIARNALSRIIGNPALWSHFANMETLAAFWALSPADRVALWGDPVDPMVALSDFEPKYLHDGLLGGP